MNSSPIIRYPTSNRIFYFSLLIGILLVKAALVFWGIESLPIGLGPDEAQYWTWSKHLDLGYYSKPPGIAWQIWSGTELFGDTQLGVRFPSIILSIFISLGVFYLALISRLRPSTAFFAAIIMALAPMGLISSFMAITDVGMVLFWTVSCCIVAHSLSHHTIPNYYALGFSILCGALFKWPIYFFWPILILALPFFSSLRSPKMLIGIAISMLGLLPSIWWNAQHQWVTFKHVLATLTGEQFKEVGTTPLLQGNFWDFVGAQVSLLSPVFFILLLIAFWELQKRRNEAPSAIKFCGFLCGTTLLVFGVFSCFQKIQGNWCDFIYPPAIVLLAWSTCEILLRGKTWIFLGLLTTILLVGAVISLPYVQSRNLFEDYKIPSKINPFRHNVGWDKIDSVLREAGYNPSTDFLFGDKYQTSSILSFYSPLQKRAYFFNIQGTRKNQFTFWPSMADEQKGKNGFFVVFGSEPNLDRDLMQKKDFYQKLLEPYFQEVQFLGVEPLFLNYGKIAKGAMLFKCVNYNGKSPVDPERY